MNTKLKVNQLKAGTIISYVQMSIQIIIGLVYSPVMINILLKDLMGYLLQFLRL